LVEGEVVAAADIEQKSVVQYAGASLAYQPAAAERPVIS
jgi:hypothetical protein